MVRALLISYEAVAVPLGSFVVSGFCINCGTGYRWRIDGGIYYLDTQGDLTIKIAEKAISGFVVFQLANIVTCARLIMIHHLLL